jgi:putative tryptophan/tyrosine transport system substrate-binding protein
MAVDRRWRPVSRRRAFRAAGVAGLGLLVGCGRLTGQAQEPAKVPRIGYVGTPAAGDPQSEALREGLRELGYREGHNLAIEWRPTAGSRERVLEALGELVALNVDAIVVTGATVARAAQNATRTIPIVIVMLSDPLEGGFIASLARPGGNITGLGSFALELSGKQLQLLAEAFPAVGRVGVLWEERNPSKARQYREIEDAATVLGIRVESLAVGAPHELASAIQAGIQAQVDALITLQSDLTTPQRTRILELVAHARLPAMYENREWTQAGGLLSYGPNFPTMHRRAAYYVDKILKGAKPADLPVERPTTFEFVINVKSAQALGLTIPQHVLLQATEVIQ